MTIRRDTNRMVSGDRVHWLATIRVLFFSLILCLLVPFFVNPYVAVDCGPLLEFRLILRWMRFCKCSWFPAYYHEQNEIGTVTWCKGTCLYYRTCFVFVKELLIWRGGGTGRGGEAKQILDGTQHTSFLICTLPSILFCIKWVKPGTVSICVFFVCFFSHKCLFSNNLQAFSLNSSMQVLSNQPVCVHWLSRLYRHEVVIHELA